jgi:uncharacterized protein YtpQ (UPF0354 family)
MAAMRPGLLLAPLLLVALALAACSTPAPPADDRGPVNRDRIVPVLKPRAWLAAAEQTLGGPGADGMPAWDPLGTELCVVYAEDRPASVRILSEAQVRGLGLSREALRALAGRNLGTVVPELHIRGGDGVYLIEAGGVYESSLVFWAGLVSDRLKVKGQPVVAVPARDVLLVTGSEDAKGLARVREHAAQALAGSAYPLTASLYVRRGQRLEPFTPADPAR